MNRAEAGQAAIDNLIASQARLDRLRDQWEELGEPVLATGGATGKAAVSHSLLRELRETEHHIAGLRARLWPGQAGRPAENVPSPLEALGPPPSRRAKNGAGADS